MSPVAPPRMNLVRFRIRQRRLAWGVKSLPWLVLTDRKHIVRDEGFALTELEDKIKTANE